MSSKNLSATFFRYAMLSISGMVAISVYILADTYFISAGLGSIGVTALNLAIPVFSLVHGTGLMLGMGGGAKYSVLISRENVKGAGRCFFSTIICALPFCFIFVMAGIFFSDTIARFLGADVSAFALTEVYVRVILLFSPAFILNNILLSFIRNDENPRLAMIAMITGSFSNIILDYVFIFPLSLGMFGAVLATGIAPVISICILSVHFLSRSGKLSPVISKPELRTVADIFSVGLPAFVTEMSSGIVIAVFNTVILGISGNIGIAAYGIIANISLVIISVFTGLSQGMQPLVSREYGSGNAHGCRSILRLGIIYLFVIAVLFYTVILLFSAPIAGVFNKENNTELSAIATEGMKIYFSAILFAGFNIIVSVYLSSCGKSVAAQIISLSRGFLVIIPATFVLSALSGIRGVWLAFPVTEAMISLFICISAFIFKIISVNKQKARVKMR